MEFEVREINWSGTKKGNKALENEITVRQRELWADKPKMSRVYRRGGILSSISSHRSQCLDPRGQRLVSGVLTEVET